MHGVHFEFISISHILLCLVSDVFQCYILHVNNINVACYCLPSFTHTMMECNSVTSLQVLYFNWLEYRFLPQMLDIRPITGQADNVQDINNM